MEYRPASRFTYRPVEFIGAECSTRPYPIRPPSFAAHGYHRMPPNPTLEKIRKSQIIDAALRIMAAQGVNSVTLDDVARASGLSKGGLIHYFPSKDFLFRETFKEFFKRVFTRGMETMNQYDDPLEKLLSFLWILDRSDPDLNMGYPLLFDGMALAAHDPEYGSLFRDWFEDWVVMLKVALKEGIESGAFAVDDVDGTARTVSAMYQGIATRWYLDPDTHSTEWAKGFLRRAVTRLVGFDSGKQP